MKRIIAAFCGLASLALLLAPPAEGKILRARTQDRGFPSGWCPLLPFADGTDVVRFQADSPSAVLTFAVNNQADQRIDDVFVVEESQYQTQFVDEPPCIVHERFNFASVSPVFAEHFDFDANGWSLSGAEWGQDDQGGDNGGSLAFHPGGSASITLGGLQKGHTYVAGCRWDTQQEDNVLSLSVNTLDPAALYLNDGRFKVEATWRTPQNQAGVGQAVPLTGDTGYFWFFDPANVEVTVKVLDACLLNQRYWVFASGLTNVRVDVRITDTVSGRTKTYTNPQGTSFKPIQDTGAFATCPSRDRREISVRRSG